MRELPRLRDLYGRLEKQGLGILSVNLQNSPKVINDYAKLNNLSFPIVMNHQGGPDVVKMYHVVTYPCTYLLDSKGKIVTRFVGFDEDKMKKALRDAGFRI